MSHAPLETIRRPECVQGSGYREHRKRLAASHLATFLAADQVKTDRLPNDFGSNHRAGRRAVRDTLRAWEGP